MAIVMLLVCSSAYAEIRPVSLEEVKDHKRIANKLNEIIDQVNQQKADKVDVLEIKRGIAIHYEATASDLQTLRGNLSNIRKTVGDPTGTVASVRTKFLSLMDVLDSSPTAQHVAVTP